MKEAELTGDLALQQGNQQARKDSCWGVGHANRLGKPGLREGCLVRQARERAVQALRVIHLGGGCRQAYCLLVRLEIGWSWPSLVAWAWPAELAYCCGLPLGGFGLEWACKKIKVGPKLGLNWAQ